jgi:hypothetical protein
MNDNDVLPNGRRPGYEGAMRTAKALSQAGIDVRIAWLPKPEGVAKIDVNEYVGAILEECHGRGLTEEESNAEARAAIHALQLNAKEMGIALLDALPDTLEGADLDKAIGELASAVAHTPELQRARCAATIAKRFKLPTATVRKIFKDAADVYAEEIAKAKKEEKPTLASLEGGSMPIRGAVSEAPDHYFTTLKIMRGDEAVDVAQPVSDFRLAPRRVLLPEKGQELLDVEVIGLGGEARGRYVIPAEAWTSARAFKTARPSAHLVWSGNDNELANVQGLLFAEEGVPRVRCTRVLGYHETPDGPRWVTPQGTLGPFGFLDAPDIVFVDERGSNELAARMRWEDVEPILVEKLAAEALPALLTVAPEEVILPILGHLYASAFAPRVRGLVGAFPLLNVSGTAGSGKTSLMRVLWRLQGIAPERSEAFGPGTPFTLSQPLAWTNTTWIFNDEFRHDLGPKMIEAYERLARLAYVGDMQMRGRADLSMSTTLLIAPWAISGEVVASGDDPALRERFVPVHPDKMWIKDHPESSEAFARLREMPLHHLAPSFAVWSLKQDARALLAKADKLVGMALVEIGARDVAIRVRNNVTTIVLGLVALDEWAASLGVVLKMSIVKAVRRVLESIIGVEDGGIIDSSKSKDAFDVFFELAATYAAMGDLKEGVHYRFSEGKLVLGLKATYFAVREAMVRGGADRAFSLDYGALRAAVRDKLRAGGGYLLPESIEENGGKRRFGKRVVIGSTVHAAVVIDLRLVPENVEAVDFPTTRASTTRDMLASFVRGEIPPPPWGPKTGDS